MREVCEEKTKEAGVILKRVGKPWKKLSELIESAAMTNVPEQGKSNAKDLLNKVSSFKLNIQEAVKDMDKHIPRNAMDDAERYEDDLKQAIQAIEIISKKVSKAMKW